MPAAAILALAVAAPPEPRIDVLAGAGMAPFTVHVHGVSSTGGAGGLLTSRLTWIFGEGPGGASLAGFNAAHVYDEPGVYPLALVLRDEAGAEAVAAVEIVVSNARRAPIYVSPAGDDAGDGATPGSAVRTMARMAQLLGDDVHVHFERGGTYPCDAGIVIGGRNIVVGAYGQGPRPVLRWEGGAETTSAFITLSASAEAVTLQDLHFQSPFPASRESVRALHVAGQRTTVRRCHFENVSYAVRAVGAPAGVMTADNTAGVLGAYFVWGEGTDHVHLRNVVAGSADEHVMRFHAERVLIDGNTLTNLSKRTIWCQDGAWARVSRNTLAQGPLMIGPRPEDPGAWEWAVLEANLLLDQGIVVRHGSAHVLIASNVIHRDGGLAIDVLGWSEPFRRTSVDVRVLHNTAINHGESGRFVSLGPDTAGTIVANNLYVAENLETGSYSTANAFVLDEDLGSTTFAHNLWAEPAVAGWGEGWQYLWPYWSHPEGYRTSQEWADLPQTEGERYRRFSGDDLAGDYTPTFNAVLSAAVTGAHVDFHGAPRPLSGPATAGAVHQGPGQVPGDVSGDGLVSVHDLVAVVLAWGPCPPRGDCPADADGDGTVGAADLSIVLVNFLPQAADGRGMTALATATAVRACFVAPRHKADPDWKWLTGTGPMRSFRFERLFIDNTFERVPSLTRVYQHWQYRAAARRVADVDLAFIFSTEVAAGLGTWLGRCAPGAARARRIYVGFTQDGPWPAERIRRAGLALRRCDAISVFSAEERDVLLLRYGFEARRVHVIPIHTDETQGYGHYAGAPPRREPYVVSLGSPNRRFGPVARACRDLGVPLVILTRPTHACDSLAEVAGLGAHVVTKADKREALTWLKHARLAVMAFQDPALPGGFTTLVHGMFLGTPFVVSRCLGMAEHVIDGCTGFLTPHGDEAALGAAIERLWGDDDLAARFADNARARAIERHSLAAAAHSFHDLAMKVLEP